MNWLVDNVGADLDDFVVVPKLYNDYCSDVQSPVSKTLFETIIQKLFKITIERVDGHTDRIKYLTRKTATDEAFIEIITFLLDNGHIIKLEDDGAVISFESPILSAGQNIIKKVFLKSDKSFSLTVANKKINLKALGIDDSKVTNHESLIKIIDTIELCLGKKVTNGYEFLIVNDTVRYFHRSNSCKRVVPFSTKLNSEGACRTCQRVYIRKKLDQHIDEIFKNGTETGQFLFSPITGERVPAEKVLEHMKLGLSDPKCFEEEGDSQSEEEEPEDVYDSGTSDSDHSKKPAKRCADEETKISELFQMYEPPPKKDKTLLLKYERTKDCLKIQPDNELLNWLVDNLGADLDDFVVVPKLYNDYCADVQSPVSKTSFGKIIPKLFKFSEIINKTIHNNDVRVAKYLTRKTATDETFIEIITFLLNNGHTIKMEDDGAVISFESPMLSDGENIIKKVFLKCDKSFSLTVANKRINLKALCIDDSKVTNHESLIKIIDAIELCVGRNVDTVQYFRPPSCKRVVTFTARYNSCDGVCRNCQSAYIRKIPGSDSSVRTKDSSDQMELILDEIFKNVTKTGRFLFSPITGERIPAEKMLEHVKLGLSNPKWLKQELNSQSEEEEQEDVFDSGTSNSDHLKKY